MGFFDSLWKKTKKETKKVGTKAKATAKSVKESLWQIASRLDWKGLREHFFHKKIFNIGDLVESDHTGLRGRIVRRGSNHLICLDKNKEMFRSWITESVEI